MRATVGKLFVTDITFPGEGSGSALQYSCLGNPMDRGAWRATVPGVAESNATGQQMKFYNLIKQRKHHDSCEAANKM